MKEKQKKQMLSMPDSRLLLDDHPAVLRAYAIANTIAAVTRHTDWMPQNEDRDAIAEELGVPALFIHSAMGRDTVTLDLLKDWADWHEQLTKHLDKEGV